MLEGLSFVNSQGFMPHGHCYSWRSDILWTHVLSDAAIGISYLIIPIILTVLVIKRKQSLPYPDLFWLFIAFISFCGMTHFMSIYVVWNPAYVIEGWLKLVTAFISVLTILVLYPEFRTFLSLPGIEKAYQKSQKDLEELQQKHDLMKTLHEVTLGREERILELKEEVNELMLKLGKEEKYNVHP